MLFNLYCVLEQLSARKGKRPSCGPFWLQLQILHLHPDLMIPPKKAHVMTVITNLVYSIASLCISILFVYLFFKFTIQVRECKSTSCYPEQNCMIEVSKRMFLL